MSTNTTLQTQPLNQKTQPEVSVNVVPRDQLGGWQTAFEVIQGGSSAVLMVLVILAFWARGSVSKLMDKHSLLLDTMREAITKNTLDLVKLNDANASKIKTLDHISHEVEDIHTEINQLTVRVSRLGEDMTTLKDQTQDQTQLLYKLTLKTEQDKTEHKRFFR